jgi:hypothetical protein
MARQSLVKNYNDLSKGVVTDLNQLAGAPENAVRNALNFAFASETGASRRKALDLEEGISGSSYVTLNSDLALGSAKVQTFELPGVRSALGATTGDVVFRTFEGKGIVYDKASDAQLADAVADATVAPPPIDTSQWQDVAWSPELGLFVAVAELSTTSMMVSSDGEVWSPVEGVPASINLTAVEWSGYLNLFVALGRSGLLYTSNNGIHWTPRPATGLTWPYACVWSQAARTFVAVGGSSQCYTSTDGITWTSRVIGTQSWRDVTWAPELGLFVAVGALTIYGGQNVSTSPDGITWTLRTVSNRVWRAVAWSASLGKFVAVGPDGFALHSSDGISWTEVAVVQTNTSWRGVAWSPDLARFVAVGPGSTSAMYSDNGTTWNDGTAPAVTETWEAVTWAPEIGKFVAVASASVTNAPAMTSNDGAFWETITPWSELVNENPSEWTVFQGVPLGVQSQRELGVLYSETPTSYKLTTSLGYGAPAIRDFQGVDDGLAVDERPDALKFDVTTATGTFYVGDDIVITNGMLTRHFRILAITGTLWTVDKAPYLTRESVTAFDGADGQDYAGWTVSGGSFWFGTGGTGTINVSSGTGLSDAHRYNLMNQGWTQEYADQYAAATGYWPSNAQVWHAGKDASDVFSPTELDKVDFGTSPAPKGRIILDPFREWRHTQVPGVLYESVAPLTASRGFTTIAKFNSRIAVAGANIGGVENVVYISPVVLDNIIPRTGASIQDLNLKEVLRFHQANDPTAEFSNELLPDDGAVVPIAGASRIYKIVAMEQSLLVFADNGVWAIAGTDPEIGFTADAFAVYDVAGAPGCSGSRGVIKVEGQVLYLADEGLHTVGVDPTTRRFVVSNLSASQGFKTLYRQQLSAGSAAAAIAYHDKANFKVYWAYNSTQGSSTPELRNSLLVLDLVTGGVYPYLLPTTLECTEGHLTGYYMSIDGFVQDPAFPASDGTIPLKLMVTQASVFGTAAAMKHAVMEFNNSGTVFDDYSSWREVVHSDTDAGVEIAAFFETWPDTLGDTSRSKQSVWVFTHMQKTETGWEDLGGGALAPIGESSLLMRSQWDWHNSAAGGKWGNQREIYRHLRPYVPEDATDTYDTGESIITTENKAYGRGRALALRFDAQPGKDAVLLGFSIPYSVEATP